MATQSDIISVLLRRLGPVMKEVGLDGETDDETNRSMDSAMVRAYAEMGHTPAAIDEVSDAELASLGTSSTLELIDRTEVYLLAEMATRARQLTDITVGDRSEKLSQLAAGLERDYADRRRGVEARYGSPANAVGLSFTTGTAVHQIGEVLL